MSKKIIRPFLKHDEDAQNDRELAKIIHQYDYLGYGLYWSIVEFLHKNRELAQGEEFLIRGYDKHSDIINAILNNENLFRIENGCYISDRILQDIDAVDKKVEQTKDAISFRWFMSDFKKAYIEFFGEEPVLSQQEIENLKTYVKKIPDLKDKFRDILYTLKNLKFDTDINFVPCANWLLKENHLGRLLNGEFGKLKHKKTAKEIKAEELARQQAKAKEQTPEIDIESVKTRKQALDILVEYSSYIHINQKLTINNDAKPLLKMFGITADEIKERKIEEIMKRQI